MGQYPNLPRTCLGFKKNIIPVPNLFIKFKPRPIRGGAGRVPEKNPPHCHSYSHQGPVYFYMN